MWHVWGRGDVHTGYWWRNLRERDHLGNPGVDRRIIVRWILKKWNRELWIGLIWLRIGIIGIML
jgi:hypothetical protein